MTAQRYRVVFEGEVLEGLQVEEVKRGLATLVKASEAQIERFFSGKRLVIKKDVDGETATKYVKAFERLGAICRMEALETHTNLEEPLMLEREAEKPKEQDVMVCPKCQFEQSPAEDCIRCGIIISRFYQRPHAPEGSTKPGGHEEKVRGTEHSSDLSVSLARSRGLQRWVVSVSLVLFVLGLAGVSLFAYNSMTGEKTIGKISFYTDYDQGLDQAFASGKPIMLVFSASWCGACNVMKREVFSHDSVANASKELVNIYVDVDKADRQLIEDYKIKYIPSVFFLDHKGQTIIQVADGRSPDDFIRNIDYMARVHSNNQQN